MKSAGTGDRPRFRSLVKGASPRCLPICPPLSLWVPPHRAASALHRSVAARETPRPAPGKSVPCATLLRLKPWDEDTVPRFVQTVPWVLQIRLGFEVVGGASTLSFQRNGYFCRSLRLFCSFVLVGLD